MTQFILNDTEIANFMIVGKKKKNLTLSSHLSTKISII